jgi:outer membrane receptor for ferrienterochelin and colicins
VRASLGALTADDFEVAEFEEAVATDPGRLALSLDGLFRVADDVHAGLEVTYTESDVLEYSQVASPIGSEYRTQSVKGSVTAETRLGLLEGVVYHNRLDQTVDVRSLPFDFDIDNEVTVARVQDLFKVGAPHAFRVGLEYRHNTMDTVPLESGEVSYDVYAASGMWDWAIAERVALVNAVRVDHLELDRDGAINLLFPFDNDDYDRDITEFSFNSGLVLRPTDRETVRLLVGRGVQLPSLIEFGQELLTTVTVIPPGGGPVDIPFGQTGNPNLDPLTVMSYEVSYDRRVDAIDGRARASVFYLQSDNLRTQSPITADFPVAGPLAPFFPGPTFSSPTTAVPFGTVIEVGDSDSFGVELGLEGRFAGNWDWGLAYTFQVVDDDLTVNRGGRLTHAVDFENSQPAHKVNAHLGYTRGPWTADFFVHYVSDYDMLRFDEPTRIVQEDISDYVVVTPRLGYQVNDNLSLDVSALNLFDHEETVGGEVESLVLVSGKLTF